MSNMFRFLISLVLPFILLTLNPKLAQAVSGFTTDFRSVYNVDNTGLTKVEHQIGITNDLAHLYTTDYSMSLGAGEVTGITVTDGGQSSLPYTTTVNDDVSILNIKIDNPQVGLGKTTYLHISYLTNEIATRVGNNLEVNIPRVAKANEFREYKREVIVPSNIGPATFLFPEPTHIEQGVSTVYTFLGLANQSLSLLFGKSQTYQLDLSYTIANPGLVEASTEIALPPDTEYQQVLLAAITPEPETITLDRDSNWMARYHLEPQESMNIQVNMFVTVSPVPVYPGIPPQTNAYPSDYNWPVDENVIINLSTELGGPDRFYEYLVNNLIYDYSRIGGSRLGAAEAISSPELATCTEFTDAFIALARAQGIPAREINGFAYTGNNSVRPQGEDILHAWPQYYDANLMKWRQIDPTWGSTTGGINYFDKLDYGHIAFVIHGQESNYPLPAGAYKGVNSGQSINVTPVDKVPENVLPHPLSPSLVLGDSQTKPAQTFWERILAFLSTLF